VFPFVERKWSKQDSVAWALSQGIAAADIVKTVSCWHSKDMPCGECKQCFKRYFVFLDNDISEKYHVHPVFGRQGQTLLLKYLGDYRDKPQTLNVDELNVVDLILRNFDKLDEPIQNIIRDRIGTLTRPVIER
jgi:hypothetical protein